MYDMELAEYIVGYNVFSDLSYECPECQDMEDEQYTCSSCYAQGGGRKFSGNELVASLVSIVNGDTPEIDLDVIREISEGVYGGDGEEVHVRALPLKSMYADEFGHIQLSLSDCLDYLISRIENAH